MPISDCKHSDSVSGFDKASFTQKPNNVCMYVFVYFLAAKLRDILYIKYYRSMYYLEKKV